MGEIQRARLVVVGQVTELLAVGRPLRDGKRRVRQAFDPCTASLLRCGRRGHEREESERQQSSVHHVAGFSIERAS
jgi:hypothetical protein